MSETGTQPSVTDQKLKILSEVRSKDFAWLGQEGGQASTSTAAPKSDKGLYLLSLEGSQPSKVLLDHGWLEASSNYGKLGILLLVCYKCLTGHVQYHYKELAQDPVDAAGAIAVFEHPLHGTNDGKAWQCMPMTEEGQPECCYLVPQNKHMDKESFYMNVLLGTTKDNKKIWESVHRIMCWAKHGPPPANRNVVMHSPGCTKNRKQCISPMHLSWGSSQQNAEARSEANSRGKGQGRKKRKLGRHRVQLHC